MHSHDQRVISVFENVIFFFYRKHNQRYDTYEIAVQWRAVCVIVSKRLESALSRLHRIQRLYRVVKWW